MKAWARAWQSKVAYLAGKDKDALDLARDGRDYGKEGPQAVRLVLAEARVLAHCGDPDRAKAALQHALELRAPPPEPATLGCLLSFQPMTTGRFCSEVAGACLDLGEAQMARRYAHDALAAHGSEDWPVTRALALFDVALAHLSGKAADPSAAATYIREAINITTVHDISSEVLAARAYSVVIASRAWAEHPDMVHPARLEAFARAVRPDPW